MADAGAAGEVGDLAFSLITMVQLFSERSQNSKGERERGRGVKSPSSTVKRDDTGGIDQGYRQHTSIHVSLFSQLVVRVAIRINGTV